MKNTRWTYIAGWENGHKFFRDNVTGLIGVADQSGYYPDETDDGVLWLDQTRPSIPMNRTGSYAIPIFQPDGRRTCTPSSRAEARYCEDHFNFVVEWPEAI